MFINIYYYEVAICTDSVIIIPFQGSPIAGENYTLECSNNGIVAAFEWLGPPNGSMPIVNTSSITIISHQSASQLQFRPLQQTHNGSYSCRVVTDEDTVSSEPIELSVKGNQ